MNQTTEEQGEFIIYLPETVVEEDFAGGERGTMILEESLETMLHADDEYNRLHAECRKAWEGIRGAEMACRWQSEGVDRSEYDRLCDLRESRYMAIKRAWEAAE